jgi:hypothetical protein
MENFESKEKQINFEKLRQEIADLKTVELKKKEEKKQYNPHFDNIEPGVLTEEDLDKYQKYLDGTLTKEEFLQYQSNFRGVEDENDPRLNFMAWLTNKITTREWLKKWKEMES